MKCVFVFDFVYWYAFFFPLAGKLIGLRTGCQFFEKNVDFSIFCSFNLTFHSGRRRLCIRLSCVVAYMSCSSLEIQRLILVRLFLVWIILWSMKCVSSLLLFFFSPVKHSKVSENAWNHTRVSAVTMFHLYIVVF